MIGDQAVLLFGMLSCLMWMKVIVIINHFPPDRCPAEDTMIRAPDDDSNFHFSISWPETFLGDTAIEECPCGVLNLSSTSFKANRTCGGTFDNGARWMAPNDSPCNFSITARRLCHLSMVKKILHRPQMFLFLHIQSKCTRLT